MPYNTPYPTILYKYRDWDRTLHKSIITQREVYLAPPSSFTDEDDCRIPIRFDLLSRDDVFKKYVFHSKEDNPNWTRSQHRTHAKKMTNNNPFKNSTYIEIFHKGFFEDFSSQFGVLSLTGNPENERMWIEYANNHQGFCIGFNSEILFKYLGGGRVVRYYHELPIIYPTPKHSVNTQMNLEIYSKKIQYIEEEEYRTHRFSNDLLTEEERHIILPVEAFNCLILGRDMTPENKEDIKNSIPEIMRNLRIIEI
ncbi:hypothetical protein Palpr_0221 [Paludibacter propionicigenes WB4]|uniref:DUF2971 domain-containing protein n=1 Tax=Paludibacter propionicigenes (strain DSM 17365 / JCM 13257 / WB4) TaxID=694427 RepID=E4T102_PALPW|nr:DUF2971 domain-containing protein [Paludibacter propionicigenes]ADQ78383.1 hypothetical protein Palpr_0221 [Paludibacter propionicigenes WB4]